MSLVGLHMIGRSYVCLYKMFMLRKFLGLQLTMNNNRRSTR